MSCSCNISETKDLNEYSLVALSCNHCGGAISQHDEKCSFCSSPLSFIKKVTNHIFNSDNLESWEFHKLFISGIQIRNPVKHIYYDSKN